MQIRRHLELARKSGSAHMELFQFFGEMFAGWIAGTTIAVLQVIINNLYILGIRGTPLGHSKQIRHWSLMRMLYWPLRSPLSASKRLQGKAARS